MTDPHDKATMPLPLDPPADEADRIQNLFADGLELEDSRVQIGPLDI